MEASLLVQTLVVKVTRPVPREKAGFTVRLGPRRERLTHPLRAHL